MFKLSFKLLVSGLLAIMLTASSCDPVPDPVPVSKEDVQKALTDAHFSPNGSDKITTDQIDFNYQVEPGFRSILTKNDIEITKVEFFFDDELISTSYSEPYKTECKKTNLSSDMTHTLYAHIYGRTCPENETYIVLPIKEYNLAGTVDYYVDYNFVGEGDKFTISANLNPEKSAKGAYIKSFTANWGPYSMGKCNSEPFTLSHIVTDPVGTERDITVKMELSNGQTVYQKFYETVLNNNAARAKNDILSSTTVFHQSDVLRCKAQTYVGKDYKGGHSLIVYFDDEQIASSKSFPFTYEKSMHNVAKGTHVLKCRWANLDSEGNEKNYGFTEETITVE